MLARNNLRLAKSGVPCQSSRERKRMIRDEETAVFLAVCRKLRHRRKWHDIQEVARYNRDKASGFSRLSSAEPSADCVELQPVQSWVIDHNDSLVEQSARDSRQYRQMRLESIRHRSEEHTSELQSH